MDDPWSRTDSKNLPSLDLISGPLSQVFDDNFSPLELKVVTPDSSEKNASFEPLPDSSAYLANLEKKLSKLKKKTSVSSGAEKKDLLFSLAGAREGHIDRFLNSQLQGEVAVDNFDSPVEESLTGTVIRHVAPHLQAVTTGELVHLLKADQLQETSSEQTAEEPEANNHNQE